MNITRRAVTVGGLGLLAGTAVSPPAHAGLGEGLPVPFEGFEDFWLATDAYVYGYPLVTMEMTRTGLRPTFRNDTRGCFGTVRIGSASATLHTKHAWETQASEDTPCHGRGVCPYFGQNGTTKAGPNQAARACVGSGRAQTAAIFVPLMSICGTPPFETSRGEATMTKGLGLALGLALAALLANPLPADAHKVIIEDQVIEAPAPPPADQVEVIPAKPSETVVWKPGYWKVKDGVWVWETGHYVEKPHVEAVWLPGHWVHHRWGSTWVAGHWE